MLKVAFIDDGIMEGIDECPKEVRRYEINKNMEIRKRKKSEKFYLSHATMCWWIFYEYIESNDICLYDIQILNPETQTTEIHKLLKALQFCLDEKIDVINMSLGTTDLVNLVSDNILEQLYANGTIMVAAQNNNNMITYPACSPFVVGVMCDYTGKLSKNQFTMVDNEIGNINIISHCDFSEIEKKYGIVLKKANSFSTPFITAMLCKETLLSGSTIHVMEYIKKKSVSFDNFFSMEYIKQRFPKWQSEIDVPIILCTDEEVIKNVLVEFRSRGYNSVGILKSDLQNYYPYLWGKELYKTYCNCSEKELELILFNATYPDIVMVHHDRNEIGNKEDYDLILCNQEDYNGDSNNRILYKDPVDYVMLMEKIEAFFE